MRQGLSASRALGTRTEHPMDVAAQSVRSAVGSPKRTERGTNDSSTSVDGFDAWTIARSTPRYSITCPGYWTRSPATASDWSTRRAALIWEPDWWAIWRPARPHAHDVSPEQSNPTAGSDLLAGTPRRAA